MGWAAATHKRTKAATHKRTKYVPDAFQKDPSEAAEKILKPVTNQVTTTQATTDTVRRT
jgi:hypothetical protein